MLWFPAINPSINSTDVNRSGQNLLLGRGGWTWGQVQKSKNLSKVALKHPWAVGPKRKPPHCSRGPTGSLGYGGASPGQGSCPPGLLVLPWILRRSSRRWTWRRVRSITESLGAHPGRWGAAKGAWRTELSAGLELFHWDPDEVLNFWNSGLPADGNGDALLHP